jgi:hypothetical protein
MYVSEYLVTSKFCYNLKATKVKILFYPLLSYFPNSIASGKEQHIDKLMSVGRW